MLDRLLNRYMRLTPTQHVLVCGLAEITTCALLGMPPPPPPTESLRYLPPGYWRKWRR